MVNPSHTFNGHAQPSAQSDQEIMTKSSGTANGHAQPGISTPLPIDSGGEGPIGGFDRIWEIVHETCGWNPVCGATMTFKGKMTKEKVIAAFERRQKHFPRFGMRLANRDHPFLPPRWEEAPRFQPSDNVEVVRLEAADRPALEKLMGHLIARDWDYSRPLWQSVLVENYSDDEGAESALLTRWHHVLADGQGQNIADLFITDHQSEQITRMEKGAAKRRAHSTRRIAPSQISRSLSSLDPLFSTEPLHSLTAPFLFFFYILSMLPHWIGKALWTRYVFFHMSMCWFLTAIRIVWIVPPHPTEGPSFSRGREFASSKRIPLSDVKTVQKAFGKKNVRDETKMWKSSGENPDHVTLNHIFVSIMTEVGTDLLAQRRLEQGPPLLGRFDKYFPQRISVFIPVSLREVGQWTTGNIVTGAISALPLAPPLGSSTTERTVEQIHTHIHETKKELKLLTLSWVPQFIAAVVEVMGSRAVLFPPWAVQRLPYGWAQATGRVWAREAMASLHAILTNIPIPANKPVKFEGIEVVSWTVLPPQGGYRTLALGVVSYASAVCVTVGCDKMPGHEGLARRICESFEARFAAYLEHSKQLLGKTQ